MQKRGLKEGCYFLAPLRNKHAVNKIRPDLRGFFLCQHGSTTAFQLLFGLHPLLPKPMLEPHYNIFIRKSPNKEILQTLRRELHYQLKLSTIFNTFKENVFCTLVDQFVDISTQHSQNFTKILQIYGTMFTLYISVVESQ